MVDFILVRALFVLILGVSAGYFRLGGEPFWPAALVGVAIGALAIILERRFERISLKRLIGLTGGVIAGVYCTGTVARSCCTLTKSAGLTRW